MVFSHIFRWSLFSHIFRLNGTQLLPSLVGEGSGVGSLIVAEGGVFVHVLHDEAFKG